MAHDLTPTPADAAVDGAPYTATEVHALSLAAQLRERVRRERATVANLQAYLSGHRKRSDP